MKGWIKTLLGVFGLLVGHRLKNPEQHDINSLYSLKFRGRYCPRCHSDKYIFGKNCPVCNYPGREKWTIDNE